jgi:HPt (histidine-containing phosphotransfer) domain-containing protein
MNLVADLVGGKRVKKPTGAISGLSPFQTNGAEQKKQDDEPIPIVSKLPSDNEAFREIIVRFVSQLGEKLQSVQQARSSGNLEEIAVFAHWLKGAGGTVGFDEFTKPARHLEKLAKEGGKESEIAEALTVIGSLAGRVRVPTMKIGKQKRKTASGRSPHVSRGV